MSAKAAFLCSIGEHDDFEPCLRKDRCGEDTQFELIFMVHHEDGAHGVVGIRLCPECIAAFIRDQLSMSSRVLRGVSISLTPDDEQQRADDS